MIAMEQLLNCSYTKEGIKHGMARYNKKLINPTLACYDTKVDFATVSSEVFYFSYHSNLPSYSCQQFINEQDIFFFFFLTF